VHRERVVPFDAASTAKTYIVDGLQAVAEKVAVDNVTTALNNVEDVESEQYKAALEKAKDLIKA
jgi:hypothetical protein